MRLCQTSKPHLGQLDHPTVTNDEVEVRLK
jgi:hypothetical protein